MPAGINQFGLDLYQKLVSTDGNVFFSPASISTAMAMAYGGARGQTAGQIARVMHFEGQADKLNAEFAQVLHDWNAPQADYQLAVANDMWGQRGYPFVPAFNQLLQRDYGAGIHDVDFAQAEQARQTINQWVSKNTQGKIEQLIPSGALDATTRLVLTNAIYFKAAWDAPFETRMTRPMPFKLASDKTASTPMMNQSSRFHYLKQTDFAALEMPYAKGRFSMLVFLPAKTDGLAELEKSLTNQKLADWMHQLSAQPEQEVRVAFPKFKMAREVSLGKTLSDMGMPEAFTAHADFSGLNAGGRPIHIGGVFHKAYVDVNEQGTEAAAATGITMRATALRANPPSFVADHPFFFVIRDNQSGGILFMGRLSDPKD